MEQLENILEDTTVTIDIPHEEMTIFENNSSQDSEENEEIPEPIEINAASKSKKNRRLIWKRLETETEMETPMFLNAPVDEEVLFSDITNPMTYFRKFITDEILESIVSQSNLYAIQKDPNKPLGLTKRELEQWLGLLFHFSIMHLPQTRLHWSFNYPCRYNFVSDVMSRDRWERIKACLHLRDNNDPVNGDKLFKVRPLVDHLRNIFSSINKSQNLCVDEQMIPFKGRHHIKQYIKSKLKKWGFKIFVLAGVDGFIYDFIPYTGKILPSDLPRVPDLGPSSNIVIHLTKSIKDNCNHCLYFDNWFSSLPLVEYLSKRQIWCCGTVRPNRLQNLKMLSDDELKKQGRGSIDAWHTSDAGTELVCVKWFDNKSVHLLSSFLQAHPVDLVERFDKKQNKTVEVPRPNIVKQYNKCMGGVDLADMLLALYRIEVKSKKFYHRFIFHLLDICVVNSWILYRRNINAEAGKQTKYMPLIYFKMLIVEGLISTGKPRSCTPKRGRPSSQMNSEEDTPPPRHTKINEHLQVNLYMIKHITCL